jgi:hypothetical protein
MWWGGEAQGGWGIACTVRTSAFITWFTYDSAGNPIWYVVSDSHPALGGTLGNTTAGTLYVTQSSPWGSSYTPASLRVTPVGTLHFDWDLHAHAGNLGVSMGGITLEIPLQRQPF